MKSFSTARMVRALMIVMMAAAALQAAEWQISQVGIGGKYSMLRFDTFGNGHVVHFEPASGTINYSFWDHVLNKWFTTTLDKGSGFCSLALDSRQRPHVAYPEGSNRLKHTYWDGTAWHTQVIDLHATVINYYTSIALDAADNPSISFYEEVGASDTLGHRLRVVSWNGRFWEVDTADRTFGAGKFNSMVRDSKGHLTIAYADVEYQNASLRFAKWNGQSWDVEILEGEGQPGTNMWSVSLLMDKNDVPNIAYTDVRKNMIKYATKKNGKWVFNDVAPVVKVAYPDRNGIALDAQGRPYISYYDAGTGVLRLAHREGEKWVAEVVDQGFSGATSCLQVDHGFAWLTYSDPQGAELEVARRKIPGNLGTGVHEDSKGAH